MTQLIVIDVEQNYTLSKSWKTTKTKFCAFNKLYLRFLLQCIKSCATNVLSAGPLTAIVNGRVTLVGVTSFGFTGCPTTAAPAFARVTAVKDWILSNSDAGSYQCGQTGQCLFFI